MKAHELTGRRFTRLLIVSRLPSKNGRSRWQYRCDCGKEGEVYAHNLLTGDSKSCGCLSSEQLGQAMTVHGHRKGGKRSSTLRSWLDMWRRCTKPQFKGYHRYGGRGITVCDRWKDFNAFLADMGVKPEGLTLERRDVDGNYEPSNCYWADQMTQGNNKHDQTCWLIDGQLMTCSQVIRHWSLNHYQTRLRLRNLPIAEGRIPRWHSSFSPVT